MLKAAGEAGTIWVTDLCNAVVRDGRIPEDRCRSWMMNVYKGKGDDMRLLVYSSNIIQVSKKCMKYMCWITLHKTFKTQW